MSEPEAAQEAEAIDATEAPAETAADPSEAIETEALAMGWKPESSFKGPRDKFVGAAEYVERGKTILPFLRNELIKRDRKIEGLEKAVSTSIQHISRADQRAYAQARADLEAELDAAATAGNAEDVRAITKDIVKLEAEGAGKPQAPAETAEFTAWREDHDWYGKDKPLSAAFDAICVDVREEGYASAKAGLKEATARLKEAFPEKFAPARNPNRALPGAVEGSGTARRGAGKTYADLPAEARQYCDELVRDKILTREQYVKTYDFGA